MQKWLLRGLVFAAAVIVLAPTTRAADILHTGKADHAATPIIPTDVGVRTAIFAKHGLDVKVANFSGGGKLHQAIVADSIDIGVGAGPELALIAKGSPALGIADVYPSVRFIGIALPEDSPIRTVVELKGKKIGVSSIGSLTYWLALELARTKRWGPHGIVPVAIGNGFFSIIAAFHAHAVDADIAATSVIFDMEAESVGRLLIPASDYEGNLGAGMIFATKHLVATNPEAVRCFLAGWFETIDFMHKHKAETVKIMSELIGFHGRSRPKNTT